MTKKIILSLLLVFILAFAISVVSAEEMDDDFVSDDCINTVDLSDEEIIESENSISDENQLESSSLNEENIIVPESEDATGIRNALNQANSGDVIQLKDNTVYSVENNVINIVKSNLTIKGNNTFINFDGLGQNGVGAVFEIKAKSITVEGIIFNNTNGPKNYGEVISGYAINLEDSASYDIINNCSFLNCQAGIGVKGGSHSKIINCYFNGSSEKITNIGHKESGTKAINMKASANNILIENNTFEGQMVDAISIASGSSYTTINNNTFRDVCYGVYFGGAVTHTSIENNSFINCGYCKDNNGNVLFNNLPVISAQKSASYFNVRYNQFEIAHNGSVIIRAESANDAHGYPSTIGDILISENNVTAVEEVNPNTINFVYLYSNAGALDPFAPINISNNNLTAGIKPVIVWYGSPADWGDPNNPYIQAVEPTATFLSVKEMYTSDGLVVISLSDVNGDPIADATIKYIINNSDTLSNKTDSNGLLNIFVNGDCLINLAFEGNSTFKSSTCSVNFTSTAKEKKETLIAYNNMTTTAVDTTTDGRIGKYFYITLKDAEGVALANKHVQIGFNGVVYDRDTDENGQARLQINLKAEGVYTFAVAFLGDDQYNGSFVVAKITVSKQTGSLTVPAKTYKASAATKTLTATFKSAKGGLVAGKKVTFTVNGKTYSATTNSKGVASVKVSLNTKGTYSFTVKYAGDNTYAAMSKTSKLVIK